MGKGSRGSLLLSHENESGEAHRNDFHDQIGHDAVATSVTIYIGIRCSFHLGGRWSFTDGIDRIELEEVRLSADQGIVNEGRDVPPGGQVSRQMFVGGVRPIEELKSILVEHGF